ncbi:MAG: hypothetical protein E4H20_00145 [Spirochaetales bacterium]|nr:MAG: hypothetical protein E4H20_00145 [Spirochaetales bacterium]
MASQISHLLVGERALRAALPSRAPKILSTGGPLFRLGCQGPDLFYHNQRTRPLSVLYGSLAHRRGFGALCAALATAGFGEGAESAWGAFALGFCTHGALDRVTHPYIVYRSGWIDAGKPETIDFRSCHPFLERVLDVLLWERETGMPIHDFHQGDALTPEHGVPGHFAENLALALRNAYPERTSRDEELVQRVINAFEDSLFLYRHSDPSVTSMSGGGTVSYSSSFLERGYRAVAIVYPENLDRSIDWANEGKVAWRHPCDPPRSSDRSYFELCEEAAREAELVLGLCTRALDGSREALLELPEAAGNGSLNVGDEFGKQTKPVYLDPLPLRAAMEEQYRMRLARISGNHDTVPIDRGPYSV